MESPRGSQRRVSRVCAQPLFADLWYGVQYSYYLPDVPIGK